MNLKQECEQTFYKELYQFDGKTQSLVMDETTGRVYLKKTHAHYDEAVFQYLSLHHHPHIANVHSYWIEDGALISLEEYIEGETLESRLQKGPVPKEEAIKFLQQICDGLQFLHAATPPIIHRDLKASNIMIAKDNTVRIIDYDAARQYKKGLERDTKLIGTEGVAAPEQYGFAQTDARTDIYALGVLMEQLFPDDPHFYDICKKAKMMDPSQRFQDVGELLQSIDGVLPKTKMKGHKLNAVSVACFLLAAIFVFSLAGFMIWGIANGRWRKQPQEVSEVEDTQSHTGNETTADDIDTFLDEHTGDLEGYPDFLPYEAPTEPFVVQGDTSYTITTGAYRFRVPSNWIKEGVYYYAEFGDYVAMFYCNSIGDLGVHSQEELFEVKDEQAQDLLDSMAAFAEDPQELKVDVIEKNGIQMIRSQSGFTVMGLKAAYEAEFFYDDIIDSVITLIFIQTDNCRIDHFEEYHGLLDSVERIAVKPEQ